MRFRIVAKFLSLLVSVITASMAFPLLWAVRDGTPDAHAFLASISSGAVFAVLLFTIGRRAKPEDMGTREAFAAVALSWVFASLQGALPFYFGGYVPTFTDAYFEAMSGFSTTGATVFTDIEINPRGILMWRAQTQWLGGMGIVVLTIALLPMLGVTMTQLFKAESPGPVLEKVSPRIQDMAIMLWKVYMGLTFVGVASLMLGGMDLYESICHIFAAVSTGGFSPKNSSVGEYNSAYFDWVLTAITFIAGANFNLLLLAIKNRSVRPYRDPEFCFYAKIVGFSTLVIAFCIYKDGFYGTVIDALRYSAFQVVSVITTTGFVTADYSKWSYFTQMLLLVLMLIGGCAGSTSGAIKCVRIQIVIQQISTEIKRFLHPQAVIPVRIGEHAVEEQKVLSAAAFIALYLLIFFVASVLIAATGQDVPTSLSAVAATLGNVGPGLGQVGPVENFESQSMAAKWIYSFCMLCGRLELYTVLLLFSKDLWKR